MKKILAFVMAIAMVCSLMAIAAASETETVRVWEDFEGYAGNAQRMAQTWKELVGGDKANMQLLPDEEGGFQLKMSWEAGTAGWGGIGREIAEDWSMFEGVRIHVAGGDCDIVVFQFSCLQEDGSSTPFDGRLDMTIPGEYYIPFTDFVPKEWLTLKELDLTAVTSVTISVVTSHGTFIQVDEIELVDLEGEFVQETTD